MFVDRRTFVAKQGKADPAVAFLRKLLQDELPGLRRWRLYKIYTGPWRHIAMEAEFESLADYERFNAALGAKFTPTMWQQWFELTDQGGGSEIWTLVE